MIALILQASLGTLAPQQLPQAGCAAYLWSVSARELVAMAPAGGPLRVQLDGKPLDLPRTNASGDVALGLPASAGFAGGGITATLDMTVMPDPALAGGARVPSGLLTVTQAGKDQLVVPVAGLVGCAEGKR